MCTRGAPDDIKGVNVVEVEANDIGAQRFPTPAFYGGQVFHPLPVMVGRPSGSAYCSCKSAMLGFDSGGDRF